MPRAMCSILPVAWHRVRDERHGARRISRSAAARPGPRPLPPYENRTTRRIGTENRTTRRDDEARALRLAGHAARDTRERRGADAAASAPSTQPGYAARRALRLSARVCR